jgi:chromosome segregation ATPase
MGVRIKTISNDIPGAEKTPEEGYHVHHATSHSDQEPVNKIWELEWEVLGKKLNKNLGKASNAELDKLHNQLKEKDEQLKHAEHRISELKKQLTALQEKQRAHKPQQPDSRRQEQRKPQHPDSHRQEQRKPPAAAAKPMTNVQKSPNTGGFRR